MGDTIQNPGGPDDGEVPDGIPYGLKIKFEGDGASFEIFSGSTGITGTGTFQVKDIPPTELSFPESKGRLNSSAPDKLNGNVGIMVSTGTGWFSEPGSLTFLIQKGPGLGETIATYAAPIQKDPTLEKLPAFQVTGYAYFSAPGEAQA